MPGGIRDRWTQVVRGDDGEIQRDSKGKPLRERSSRWGKGARWQLVWEEPNGTYRYRSYSSRDQARLDQAAIRADRARGVYLDVKKGDVSFAEYVNQLQSAKGTGTRAYSTDVNREYLLRLHILPVFGPMALNKIRVSQVRGWAEQLDLSGLAKSSQINIIRVFSSIMKAAVDDKLIVESPARPEVLKLPKATRRNLSPWSVSRIISVIEAMPEQWQLIPNIAAFAGLRIGEILALGREDVDIFRKEIQVRHQLSSGLNARRVLAEPKYQVVRTVPIPMKLVTLVVDRMKKLPPQAITLPLDARLARKMKRETLTKEFLFTNYWNGEFHPIHWSNVEWKKAKKQLGIEVKPQENIHMLRHFYATSLVQGGVPIPDIAKNLGHSDPAFTLRTYIHATAESDLSRNAIEEMMLGGISVESLDDGRNGIIDIEGQ